MPNGSADGNANTPAPQTCRGALERLVDEGHVRNLGVSNFSLGQIEDLLSWACIKPVVNQVELHPFLPQRKLVGGMLRKVPSEGWSAPCLAGMFLSTSLRCGLAWGISCGASRPAACPGAAHCESARCLVCTAVPPSTCASTHRHPHRRHLGRACGPLPTPRWATARPTCWVTPWWRSWPRSWTSCPPR